MDASPHTTAAIGNFAGHGFRRRLKVAPHGTSMSVTRLDNVGIVVEDIDAAIEFFTELGLALEGRMPIEGEWAGRVTGVRGQGVEIAMARPAATSALSSRASTPPPSRPITARPR